MRLQFPLNFVTAPLIADLFLLAILAIGRQEVHDGTIGAENISPLDIMLFFLSLAYIAISIDASGLIRWLAFKVLQWGGNVGHRLFFYLYAFFFCLASFIGNDPIILSGTAFLAYSKFPLPSVIMPQLLSFRATCCIEGPLREQFNQEDQVVDSRKGLFDTWCYIVRASEVICFSQ